MRGAWASYPGWLCHIQRGAGGAAKHQQDVTTSQSTCTLKPLLMIVLSPFWVLNTAIRFIMAGNREKVSNYKYVGTSNFEHSAVCLGATPFRTGYKFALRSLPCLRGALTVDRRSPLFGLRSAVRRTFHSCKSAVCELRNLNFKAAF